MAKTCIHKNVYYEDGRYCLISKYQLLSKEEIEEANKAIEDHSESDQPSVREYIHRNVYYENGGYHTFFEKGQRMSKDYCETMEESIKIHSSNRIKISEGSK